MRRLAQLVTFLVSLFPLGILVWVLAGNVAWRKSGPITGWFCVLEFVFGFEGRKIGRWLP